MKCVDTIAEQILRPVSPEPVELWERSNADIGYISVDDDRPEAIAATYPKSRIHMLISIGEPEEVAPKGELVGYKQRYSVEMTTGITRDVVVYIPLPKDMEQSQVTIHMDTPWMTGVDGHNDKISEAFMHHTHQPVILVGPEKIQKHADGLYVVKNLGAVAAETSQISLALAAQDSMQIAAEIAETHKLSRLFVQVGESRAAMLAPAKEIHAEGLNIQNIYYDLTDPTVPENLRVDPARNLMRLAEFLPNEFLHTLPVGVDLARRGTLRRLLGTIPLNLEYMIPSLLGTSRAIGSGEAGEFPALLPDDKFTHILNFRYNPVAGHKIWREKYQHTQFAGVDLNGAHLGLAYSSVQRHVIDRINRLLYELYVAGGDISRVDKRRVHYTDDKRYLDRREHMPDVA